MTEKYAELKARLVVRRKRDGRCVYDERAKQELILASLKPGVSVARMAMEHGVNANLLRAWIAAYQQRSVKEPSPIIAQTQDAAFVAVHVETDQGKVQSVQQCERVMSVPQVLSAPAMTAAVIPAEATLPRAAPTVGLHVQLPNGVEFDLGETSLQELSSLVQMLGQLPCSASTKG